MRIKYICAIFALLLILSLTGCWDRVEIENRGFVISICVDKAEKQDMYKLTLALPNVEALIAKGGDAEKNQIIKTSEAESFSNAVRKADNDSSKKLYLGLARAVLFGKDILEDSRLFSQAIDALERNADINRKIVIMAAEGDAAEMLEAPSEDAPMFGMFAASYFNNPSNLAGVTIRQPLSGIISALRENGCGVIPMISLKDKAISIGGLAVMKDFELAGYLDEQETRGYLWVLGKAQGASIGTDMSVMGEKLNVPLYVDQASSRISFYEEDDGLCCRITVDLTGSVEEFRFANVGLLSGEMLSDLETQYEMDIAGEITDTADKLRYELETDAYQFEGMLKKKAYGLYLKYGGENWEESFSSLKIIPVVRVRITGGSVIK